MGKLKADNFIFFLQDGLDSYSDFFLTECKEFELLPIRLETIEDEIKQFDKSKNRETILVIIKKSLYTNEVKEIIKKAFFNNLNIPNPHLLLVSQEDSPTTEQDNIIARQNFFYKLPGKEFEKKATANSLYFFLILIFQHMKDLSRLNDYIINSFQTIVNSELINQQKVKIEKLYDELEALSKIDVLTNVLNRRAFFEAMETEKTRTLRDIWRIKGMKEKGIEIDTNSEQLKQIFAEHKKIIDENPKGSFFDHYGRLTCMMIDIDFFKKINDTYGHLMGDKVLKELGELLNSKKIFRDNDIIGRYGGEEFVVILPETSAQYAKIPAERLRKHVKTIIFSDNKSSFNITISIGMSELSIGDTKCEDLINRADQALYYAKENGRDMTVIFSEIYDTEENTNSEE